jgi:anaerobic magnesium-protoporphyrin IX monomethyl ester cyclase
MKVLIINPPSLQEQKFTREGRCEQRLSSFQYVMVPISLPSVAAVIREDGHEVKILDCIAQDISLDSLINLTNLFTPQLIIFNFSTVTFWGDSQVLLALRKKSLMHFTAIGVHITTLPEESLRETALDSVIRGEPEETAKYLANALEQGTSLEEVEGISFKKNDKVIHNPDREYIKNLDSLPFPARDLLKNEKYTMPISNRPYTLIITSRGCPHNCIYCTASCYYGKKLRERSAKNIVDEMVEVKEKYGINDVTMWSDTFTLNKSFVLDVCDEIEKRRLKIKWMCNSRVDTVDPEMLARMAETGCTVMSYGVESGVQEILDNINKKTTIKQIKDAFYWTRKAGIETIAHVIFGLPGETPATIKETFSFVKKIRPDYVQFYCAVPFPGTDFYKLSQKENWLITDDWSKFEINQAIISTPLLSAEMLDKARKDAFRRFYMRPTYMLRRLKNTSSAREVVNLFKEGFSFFKDWVIGT